MWQFDAITHATIQQTRLDRFFTRFSTQCADSEA